MIQCGAPAHGQRRLRAVASLVPQGARVADVGTGHGILPWLLLTSGRARHCLASEADPRRLAHVRRFDADHPLAGRLELRCGDGLSVLRPDDGVGVLTIAGLGARSILRILQPDTVRALGLGRVVLQSQTEPARLRRGLKRRSLHIVDERLVRERGRFYEIIAASPDRPEPTTPLPLTEEELYEAGPCLVRSGNPEVAALWRRRLAHRQALVPRAPSAAGRTALERRCETARRVLALLEARTSRPPDLP